jgi:hypothetical protein
MIEAKKEEMRWFLVKLAEIREDKERTPTFVDDVIFDTKDFDKIIIKKPVIYKINSRIRARVKVIEMLCSIKKDFKFLNDNKIDESKLLYKELSNNRLEIIGYQTEILDRYLLQVLKTDRKRNNTVDTSQINPPKKFILNDNNLIFGLVKIPVGRGQKLITEVFLSNAEEMKNGRRIKRGESVKFRDLKVLGRYKNEKALRSALNVLRRKLKKFDDVIKIENCGTGIFKMVIKYP